MHNLLKGLGQVHLLHIGILLLIVFVVTDCLQAGSLESVQVFHTCRWKLCYLGKQVWISLCLGLTVFHILIQKRERFTVYSNAQRTYFISFFCFLSPPLCLHLALSAFSSFLTSSPLTGLQFLFFYPRLPAVCFINQWVVPLYCSSGWNQIHSGIECV